MKTDDAVSSFLKSIYMTLVHVYGCTVLCTSEKKVMMSYDSIMGRTTDSLIGPQPVTLELKNLDKPQPGTISILEGYTVTDKADGDRAQVFVTDGKSLPHRQSSERHDRRYGMRRRSKGTVLTVSSSLRHRTIYLRLYAVFDIYALPATWLPTSSRKIGRRPSQGGEEGSRHAQNDDAHRHDEAEAEDVRGSRS
jgi:hypothetical protein